MKIYKLILAAIGLLSVASLQAQEAKTVFVNIPDSLCPLLTKMNREDCIDFLESKMRARVENRFGQQSEMTALSKDYIRMQMSAQGDWQMKVLALNDTTKVICTVVTACAPACDSSIRFYTTDWQPLPTSRFLTLPTMNDFLIPPTDSAASPTTDGSSVDTDTTSVYAFDEAGRQADMLLMKVDLQKDATELTVTLTTPDYMSKEAADKLKPFIRRSIVYQWKNGAFSQVVSPMCSFSALARLAISTAAVCP